MSTACPPILSTGTAFLPIVPWYENMTSSVKPEALIAMLSDEDRATATGNMHKKFGEVRLRVSRAMRADRRTEKHTNRHTHQNISYRYRTPLGGEVTLY